MGVHVETLCCGYGRALSVQTKAGKCTTERKVRCSKICVTALRCHCRLSGVSLLANANSLQARALRPPRIPGTKDQNWTVSFALASLRHTQTPRP